MVDIHSHFLPCIDDGAKSPKDSIAMLGDNFAQGVELCVATPHVFVHKQGAVESFLEKRQKSFESLKSAVDSTNGGKLPELRLGAEVYMDNNVSLVQNIEKLCIEKTDLLLVEFPVEQYDPQYSEWLYLLTLKGLIPIVAHIERYPFFDRLYEDISDFKVVYQMNAKTVTKHGGRRLLEMLLNNNETVVVSSDMHNLGMRKSYMKKAYGAIKKHFPGYEQALLRDNALDLIK